MYCCTVGVSKDLIGGTGISEMELGYRKDLDVISVKWSIIDNLIR